MQCQRGGLVPIGDALSGMGGPVKAIREASPQAVHHFTLADQVNSVAAPELVFAGCGPQKVYPVLCQNSALLK